MGSLNIALAEGSYIDTSDDQWPIIATASQHTLVEKDYVTMSLVVRRHADGRHLVHSLVEQGGQALGAKGAIVAAGDSLTVPLWRVAAENRLSEWHINECQKRLAGTAGT